MKRRFTIRSHKHIYIGIAVLIVVGLLAVMGVRSVKKCLRFDEEGAHVVDYYGVLAMEAQQKQTGSASSDEQTEQTQTEQTEAVESEAKSEEKTEAVVRSMMLAPELLTDSEKIKQITALHENGVLDAVVVTIKDNEGKLNLPVETQELEDIEYITENNAEQIAQGIGALSEAGLNVIGRICCFHDKNATARNSDLALQFESGGTWLDYDSTRWLDPTNYDTVSYLCDVARAAQKAGCTGLMLTDFTFPPRGHLDKVEFDSHPDDQASVLLEVLEELQTETGDMPIGLSAESLSELLELSANGVEDGIALGDVTTLLSAAEHLYVAAEDADSIDSLQKRLQENTQLEPAKLIPIFKNGSDWKAYTGSAVWNARTDSEEALSSLSE